MFFFQISIFEKKKAHQTLRFWKSIPDEPLAVLPSTENLETAVEAEVLMAPWPGWWWCFCCCFAFPQGKPDCLGSQGSPQFGSYFTVLFLVMSSQEDHFPQRKWWANAKGGEGGSAPSSLEMANFLLDDDKLNAFLVNWQHAGFLENGAWKLECISYWQWG